MPMPRRTTLSRWRRRSEVCMRLTPSAQRKAIAALSVALEPCVATGRAHHTERAEAGARRSAACKHARARELQAGRAVGQPCSLVPLDGRALDAHKRQGDLGVPLLGRLEDEVVQRLAAAEGRGVGVSAMAEAEAEAEAEAGAGERLTSWCSGRSRRLHVAWRANMALAWTWTWCAMCDVLGSQSRESGRAPGKW